LLLLPLLAAGCSPGKGTVSGQVTYDGKPLKLGTISFHPEGGRHDPANGKIVDGAYSVDDVTVGPNKVTVLALDPDKAGGTPAPGAEGEAGARDAPVTGTKKHAKEFVPIPSRYADPDKSGLHLDVHTGTQTFPVPLEK
jgi:hypothetical protein